MVSTLTSTSLRQNFCYKDQDSYFICQCLSQVLADIYALSETSKYLINHSNGIYFVPLQLALKEQHQAMNQATQLIVERIQILGWFNLFKYNELLDSVETKLVQQTKQRLYLSISAYHGLMSQNLKAIATRCEFVGDFVTAALLDKLSIAHYSYAQQLGQILDLN